VPTVKDVALTSEGRVWTVASATQPSVSSDTVPSSIVRGIERTRPDVSVRLANVAAAVPAATVVKGWNRDEPGSNEPVNTVVGVTVSTGVGSAGTGEEH